MSVSWPTVPHLDGVSWYWCHVMADMAQVEARVHNLLQKKDEEIAVLRQRQLLLELSMCNATGSSLPGQTDAKLCPNKDSQALMGQTRSASAHQV